MSKNLNSFILPDNVIETMKKKLIKTKKIRVELGFNLCQVEGSNELRDDNHCIGSNCNIFMEETCKTGKKVGAFHTHPKNGAGISDPSIADLLQAYHYGVSCTGGETDKKIRCYVRKDKEFNKKDYDTIAFYREKYRRLNKAYYSNTRDRIKESYFDTIDII